MQGKAYNPPRLRFALMHLNGQSLMVDSLPQAVLRFWEMTMMRCWNRLAAYRTKQLKIFIHDHVSIWRGYILHGATVQVQYTDQGYVFSTRREHQTHLTLPGPCPPKQKRHPIPQCKHGNVAEEKSRHFSSHPPLTSFICEKKPRGIFDARRATDPCRHSPGHLTYA